MGNPFKSKKKVTVGTVTNRIIQDDLVPNAVKTGVLKSIFSTNKNQLVENVLEQLIGSIGVKAERMYNYGKNHYMFGLPKSTLTDNTSGESTVHVFLEELLSKTITIDYYHFGSANYQHFVWKKLSEDYNYDVKLNELKSLTTIKGYPVYLWNFQITLAAASIDEFVYSALDQWEPSATSGHCPGRPDYNIHDTPRAQTPIRLNSTASEDTAAVTVRWLIPAGIQEETFNISLSEIDPQEGYFQIRYSYSTGLTTQREYWTYQEGLGTYPVLDAIHSSEFDDLGSFFPFGYLRYNNTDVLSSPESDEFKQSKKLLKYLGINYEDMAEQVKDPENNPDIDDVLSAIVMLAVPMDTENKHEMRYLFDFFRAMYLNTGGTDFISVPTIITESLLRSRSSKQISMIVEDTRFKLAINVEGLISKVISEVRGPVGSYDYSYQTEPITQVVTKYNEGADEYYLETVTTNVPSHIYYYQSTETVCETYHVLDPEILYYVSGKYTTSSDDIKKNLLIPIDYSITDNYPIPIKEALYARSLHYVFNSYVVTKVKWYQSGFFSFLLTAAALVITVFTQLPAWQALSTAMASAATTQAALTLLMEMVLEKLFYAVLFSVALDLFVKLIGPELAILIAVVATIYALGTVAYNGGFKGIPWAEDLLKLSTGLTKSVNKEIQADLLGLSEDYSEFNKYVKEQTKLLDTAKDLMSKEPILSPFVIFGESPDEYYGRTVESGNIGVLGFAAVNDYVRMALTLPKLSETIEDAYILA